MKRLAIVIALLVPFAHAAGKVYSWKDANGNVIYSDQPPPGQKVEEKAVKTNNIQTSGGGYEMREAIRKNPVTLWANNCGEACDQAKALLTKRGVPYSLRNPESNERDLEELKRLSGAAVVPVLQVGTAVNKGFRESSWHAALDGAGYPRSADPTVKAGPKAEEKQPAQN
ncbi:glutaredoxin family protein [Chitinimonas lacunae]|uniref:Glutaredoxin family protein n=1 Tax=Chitinimonas lacunae TaxID=1963018 RepID=A0ABV8MVS5_9NEIS